MTEPQTATFEGRSLPCPVCGHTLYRTMKFLLANALSHAFDWKLFGREGLMLICNHCTHVQHFANPNVIKLHHNQPHP